MSDTKRPGGEHLSWVDPERQHPANAFDSNQGVSGMGYSPAREQGEGDRHPSGEVGDVEPSASDEAPDADTDLPPQNGRRASFDPRTGEVHGSGAGAGGGNPGEDFDSDSASGDGYPQTGSEGRTSTSHDLGPPHFKQ